MILQARRGIQRALEALPRPAFHAGAPFLSAWMLDGEPFDERTINRAYDDFCDLHLWLGLRGAGRRSAAAALWLHSEGERAVELRVGNTGPVEVLLGERRIAVLTERAARRDGHAVPLGLPPGWSRLELRLASDGPPWGFYARVTDASGASPPGVVASPSGPGDLRVNTTALPAGFAGWPYVELANRRPEPRASAFRLMAGGGSPPYRWSAEGLPDGFALAADGTLTGTPRDMGAHELSANVADAAGARARRSLVLEVREPPTRWFDDAPLTAFVHLDKPEAVPVEQWNDELAGLDRHARDWARRASEAGAAALGITAKHHDSWANWPTAVTRTDGTPARRTGVDTLAATRSACAEHGLRFGMYYSLIDNWHPGYRSDMPDYLRFQYLQMEELLDRYEPSIVWLDGHWEDPGAEWEYDSLISLIHGRAADCVVANNPGRRVMDVSEFGRGDVDVRTFEGHSATDHMPKRRSGPNPRPLAAEKVAFTCDWWSPGPTPEKAGCSRNRDPHEWLRALSELVCAGGKLQLGLGPGYPGAPDGAPAPGELHQGAQLALAGIGAWLEDGRAEAFEGVRPGPLRPGRWGASVERGDTIWLHVRRPGRLSLDGLPAARRVTGARLVPGGDVLAVDSSAGRVRLDLSGVDPDPVVTLVRLETGPS